MLARSPDRSRKAILDAAEGEFVERGYLGASVNKIAERAELNKRMLYHYFGSKEGLFTAVLESVYERLRTGERSLELDDERPVAAMEQLVRFSYDHLVAHPRFVALLTIENLHDAAHLKRSQRIRTMHSPLIGLIRTLLDEGVASGDFRADVDPVELYVSIAALCFFHLSNRHTLSVVFDRDMGSRAALSHRREHVVDVVMGFLRGPERGAEAPPVRDAGR